MRLSRTHLAPVGLKYRNGIVHLLCTGWRMKEYRYPVTTTLKEAAIEIVKSSFAIYKVPDTIAEVMNQAWGEAANVLNDPQLLESKKWTRIIGGHLYGYNEPSLAKRLFRAFPTSNLQPWPNERFRDLSCDLAHHLHGILVDCYSHLRSEAIAEEKNQEQKRTSNEGENILASKAKRRRLQYVATENCPLDYFLYHNLHPTVQNCIEHIDRGLLIAVCLTDVPGLEIQLERGKDCESRWICPEIAIHNSNLYKEKPNSSVSNVICIMAGGQLSQILQGKVQPCTHRVRNKLKRARLSMSYELRL